METNDSNTIRYRIMSLLIETRKNQSWLAEELKVSNQSVSGWLRRNSIPVGHLPTIAKIFNVTTDWLLGNSDEKKKPELSDSEKKILALFASLPVDVQLRELDYLERLRQQIPTNQ